MRRFQVGDRVRVIAPGPYYGTETTVMSELKPCGTTKGGGIDLGEMVHEIDIEDERGWIAVCTPDCLVPIHDGDEPGSWDELDEIWQPKSVACPKD